jgi:hypothetical protein
MCSVAADGKQRDPSIDGRCTVMLQGTLRTSTAIPYGDWLDRANGDSAVSTNG